MAPHSNTLAWKIPWTEEPGGLQSMGSLELDKTEQLHFHVSLSCTGEGNGNPLQYSCLENPVDRGAWWAAVHGVSQSRMRLKRLSMHACIGEGIGNLLQCSCLENPREGGAWGAAVYGVAQSWTRLKRLSSSSSSSSNMSGLNQTFSRVQGGHC